MTESDRGTLQEPQVRAMFDRIAGFYDVMNSVMTAGLHHGWRRRAADLAGVGPGDRVLDVATGTGDLALELARRVAPGGAVVASDFSQEMLTRARAKAPAGAAIAFEWANAMALPYADGEFAAATVGFGARNFSDLDLGLREMARVVRPGGRVVVLEITTPTRPPLSTFYSLWFDRVVPVIGRVAGDPDAYSYLPDSVRRFPAPRDLAAKMDRCGLDVRYVLTAGGIIALHVGTRRPVAAPSAASSAATASAASAPSSAAATAPAAASSAATAPSASSAAAAASAASVDEDAERR